MSIHEPVWTLRTRGIRRRRDAVRWTLDACNDDGCVAVIVDATERGSLLGLQSAGYIGTTEGLDRSAAAHIASTLAQRDALQELGQLDGGRRGRSDRLRWTS
jgi:hypothetical protein